MDANAVAAFGADDGRCVWANDTAHELYGYAAGTMIGLTIDDLRARGTATLHRRSDGTEFAADEAAFTAGWNGAPASFLLTVDATEHRRAAQEQRDITKAVSQAHRLVSFAHWSSDLVTGVLTWSDELWSLIRVTRPENTTSPGSSHAVHEKHIHEDDRAAVMAHYQKTLETGEVARLEYRSIRGDGTMHWVEGIVAREDDENGKPLRLVGTCVDITERKEASEQLLMSARSDPLTGLANRMLLGERLAAACSSATRRGTGVAILFIDLDGFKEINDTLGHPVGDALLQNVAARLRGLMRTEDEVARTGGDEFVILLEDGTSVEAATAAQRIVDAFHEPIAVGERDLTMSLSIGVACFPADGHDPDTLLRNADTAMYQAKRAQHGSFRLFEESMHDSVVRQFQEEFALRAALRSESVTVRYEPSIARDGRVSGAVTTPYWDHDGAMPSAGAVRRIAEKSGLIVPLDAFVLREACRQNAIWIGEGRRLVLAVGVSAHSIATRDFVAGVRLALDDAGLDGAWIELVIAEASLHADLTESARKITAVRALGVRVALGAFGTGGDSLAIMRVCPFDTLRLDQTLVRGLVAGGPDAVIASAMVFAAHRLGARAVAEGVESEQQRAALSALRCDDAQGRFYGGALPASGFTDYVDAGPAAAMVGWVA